MKLYMIMIRVHSLIPYYGPASNSAMKMAGCASLAALAACSLTQSSFCISPLPCLGAHHPNVKADEDEPPKLKLLAAKLTLIDLDWMDTWDTSLGSKQTPFK